jgi:hypothetical protein
MSKDAPRVRFCSVYLLAGFLDSDSGTFFDALVGCLSSSGFLTSDAVVNGIRVRVHCGQARFNSLASPSALWAQTVLAAAHSTHHRLTRSSCGEATKSTQMAGST